MFRTRTVLSLTALALVIGIGTAPAAQAQSQQAQAAQSRKPVANAEKMNRAAFESLADDDIVEVNGKAMTKKQVVAEAKAIREAKPAALEESEKFENEKASFEKKQKAALDAENAAVVSKMSELRKAGGVGNEYVRKAGGGQQEAVDGDEAISLQATPTQTTTATPAISGMLGQLKPGSAVILFGSNFGTLEGEVRMYGTFTNSYVKLVVDSWGNGGIGVFVPSDIKGVLDQQVTIKIVTKAGISSNYKTAPFTAARELRKMTMNDFSKKECRDAALSVDKCTTVGQSGCTSSICGDHLVPIYPGAAVSTDRWAATLKNTWTYDHHGFAGGYYFSPGYEWVNPVVVLATYAAGKATAAAPKFKNLSTATTPSFEIEWATPSLWADTYKLNVYVVGPAGTAHI